MGCGASNSGGGKTTADVMDAGYASMRKDAGEGANAPSKNSSRTSRTSVNRNSRNSNTKQFAAKIAADGETDDDFDNSDDPRSLLKMESKLGQKAIKNSFVVQKQRNKKKREENDVGTGRCLQKGLVSFKIGADEFASRGGATFELPAENADIADPNMQGVNLSGPSFKMMRGKNNARAALLKELNGGDGGGGDEDRPSASKPRKSAVKQSVPEQENSNAILELDGAGDSKQQLYSSDVAEIMKGVTFYREQLCVVNPPVAAVRREGVVPRLVQLLDMDTNHKLQYEVVWTLTNICSAEHGDCQDVVDQGAVPRFIRMLKSCEEVEVVEQVIWALGNIAADSPELQKIVLEEGIVEPLSQTMEKNMDKPALLRHCAWFLSNLCRPKPQSNELYDMIPIIKTILNQSDDLELVTHTLWSLAYISADEEVLDELADLKHVLPKMVTWVQEASSSMTTPSLRIFGNLCSGSNDATQMVVDARGIPAVIACLLATQRETIKKECIWTLSNISAGTSNQVSALLEADCFPNVITTMREHSALRLECAYVLANPWSVSVKASPAVASKLIQQRVICELVSLLDADCSTAVLLVVLEGLSDAKKKGLQILTFMSNGIQATDAEMFKGDTNPVVDILQECDALSKLNHLKELHKNDELLTLKLTAFINAADLF